MADGWDDDICPGRLSNLGVDFYSGLTRSLIVNEEQKTSARILRFGGDFQWDGASDEPYKREDGDYAGVRRVNLAGMHGENTSFHFRYFEIEIGGFTTLEKHRHEHVVMVLRGRGEVQIDGQWHEVGFGDVFYVPPEAVHQLRHPGSGEPFGFVCVVDAMRDKPVPVQKKSVAVSCYDL